MLFERTRKVIKETVTGKKPTCRGMARAARRRGLLRSNERIERANAISKPWREAKSAAIAKWEAKNKAVVQ